MVDFHRLTELLRGKSILHRLYETILSYLNARVQIASERELKAEVEALKERLRTTEQNLEIKKVECCILEQEVQLLSAVNARNVARVRAETAKTGMTDNGVEADAATA